MSTPSDQSEPIFDVAEFSSFELFSPDVDRTLWFFKDLLGMIETERSGDSVFLRGWHDPYNHSLKVTHRDHAGMGFAGWRATSKPALERRVKALKETGRGRGWVEGECGMGDSFEFTLPDGGVQRIHWDVDYYRAPEDEQSVLKNRPQRRPLAGVPVESLDHLNLLARNVTDNKEFFAEALGFRLTEHIVFGDDTEGGAWMRLNTRSHDVAFTRDASGPRRPAPPRRLPYGNAAAPRGRLRSSSPTTGSRLEGRARPARDQPGAVRLRPRARREPDRAGGQPRVHDQGPELRAGALGAGHAGQRDHLVRLPAAEGVRHLRDAELRPDASTAPPTGTRAHTRTTTSPPRPACCCEPARAGPSGGDPGGGVDPVEEGEQRGGEGGRVVLVAGVPGVRDDDVLRPLVARAHARVASTTSPTRSASPCSSSVGTGSR